MFLMYVLKSNIEYFILPQTKYLEFDASSELETSNSGYIVFGSDDSLIICTKFCLSIGLNNFQPPRTKLTNPAFMHKLASIYLFTVVTFATGNLINDICTRFVLCSSVRLCLPSGAKISSNSRMMFSLVNIFSCCFI